jgi:hypothetical protein
MIQPGAVKKQFDTPGGGEDEEEFEAAAARRAGRRKSRKKIAGDEVSQRLFLYHPVFFS